MGSDLFTDIFAKIAADIGHVKSPQFPNASNPYPGNNSTNFGASNLGVGAKARDTAHSFDFVGDRKTIPGFALNSKQLAGAHAAIAIQTGEVGKPQFHLNAGGSGNHLTDFGASAKLGVGTKVWESSNGAHSLGLGANVGQDFAKSGTLSYSSRPDFGAAVGYRFRF